MALEIPISGMAAPTLPLTGTELIPGVQPGMAGGTNIYFTPNNVVQAKLVGQFSALTVGAVGSSSYFPLVKSFNADGTNVVVSGSPQVVHALNGTGLGVLNAIGEWAIYEMTSTIVSPVAGDQLLFNPQYNSGSLISFNPSTYFITPASPPTYYGVIVTIKTSVISPLAGGDCTYAFKYRIEISDPTGPGAPLFLLSGGAYRNSTTFGTGITYQVTIDPGSASVINAESATVTGVA